jgi:hypothetical protein|tara:strand:+ start:3747 stop:4418 length:672 start_codon:yes stop_codon:yes gene_type:complete
MSVGSREDYRVGTRAIEAPLTMDVEVDNSTISVIDSVNGQLAVGGVQLTPRDAISGAISAAVDNEVIRLLPGRYRIRGTLTIDKSVTIEAIGNVRIVSDGIAFNVTGTRVNINGIQFEQIQTTETKTILLAGTFGAINNCTFVGYQTNGVYVSGNNCAIRNCRFVPDVSQSSADADIYWADGASNGIALGNMWSGERGYVISYKSGTGFAQAANADSAAIQTR